ncbi:MAG: phosphoglycerate mutase, partial [Planctomycetota bacterium]|nr:phosphoglycerate mutase [Planctomycetota bacterium]
DSSGKISDRRAGRISTQENERLCMRLRDSVQAPAGTEVFFEVVSEHRALLVIRGEGLSGAIADTDPQETGVAPLPPRARKPEASRSVEIVSEVLKAAQENLKDEPKANGILARGFDQIRAIPTLRERFKLQSVAIARYPMYRGLARLVGMDLAAPYQDLEDGLRKLRSRGADDTFVFFHVKDTDKAGEDGDFDAKVDALERIDRIVPDIVATDPDVFVVTGDHSTPALLGGHSWHPVPVMLHARTARKGGASRFTEAECVKGGLSRIPMTALMPIALGHAGKLMKFGA